MWSKDSLCSDKLIMEVLVEQHGVELLKDNAQAVMFSVNPSISWRIVDLPSSTCPLESLGADCRRIGEWSRIP